MAGTWKFQNKRRPGAYINVKGQGHKTGDSTIGRLLMINTVPLEWGKDGIIELTADTDFKAKLGRSLNDPALLPLKEALKNAETVLFVNTNRGTFARGENEKSPWQFEAKYLGERGNDIVVNVDATPEGKVIVQTIFDKAIVDEQSFPADTQLENFSNDYVTATKIRDVDTKTIGSLTIELKGAKSTSSDDAPNGFNLDLMNDALETEHYSVAAYNAPEHDSHTTIYSLLVEAVKRIRDTNGVYVRAVVPDMEDSYNFEGVSVVKNGFIEGDGTQINTEVAAGYFAGLSCSVGADASLTYQDVPDAIQAFPKLNNQKTIEALNAGQIVFTTKPGQQVVIEQDINNLTKFTDEKPKEFSKNRVIRTLDEICTNSQETFEKSFLGKVSNNVNGRDLFKTNRISYLTDLQNRNVIQNFSPEDVEVLPGNDTDSIVVNLAITPVDSMEKLYMTVLVN